MIKDVALIIIGCALAFCIFVMFITAKQKIDDDIEEFEKDSKNWITPDPVEPSGNVPVEYYDESEDKK